MSPPHGSAHIEIMTAYVLNPNNQAWAGKAGALVAIASYQLAAKAGSPDLIPNGMHAFDTGAAWAYMAMQAHLNGFSLHGIGGFDKVAGAHCYLPWQAVVCRC